MKQIPSKTNHSGFKRRQVNINENENTFLKEYNKGEILDIYRIKNGQQKYLPFSIEIINPLEVNIRFELNDIKLQPAFVAYTALLHASFIFAKAASANVMEFMGPIMEDDALPYSTISVSCQTLGEAIRMGEGFLVLMEEAIAEVTANFLSDQVVVNNRNDRIELLDPFKISNIFNGHIGKNKILDVRQILKIMHL